MSAYAPNNMQNNWPTQRHTDASSSQTQYHSSIDSPQGNGGITERVSGIFGAERRDELPMYKDKPASRWRGHMYPGSSRKHPWFLQRRSVAILLTTLALISWWFGILSPISWFGSSRRSSRRLFSPSSWEGKAAQVKETFQISLNGYVKHAWGYDEFKPVSKGHRQMTPKGMGWIIVDALDTMMIMNLTDEVRRARTWIHDNLDYDQDHDVNTFESTIRMLGGLLSAHYLSTEFDIYAGIHDFYGDDLYIEKATDLADRLLGAFESNSGVPFASVNLHTMKGIPSHTDGGSSSTAEATTIQLEMKYLSKLTGEDVFWDHAENVMKVIDDNNAQDGLVPIFMSADTGTFRGNNIRMGSRGDSYYEYLIKQYLQTSEQEPLYQAMWNESLAGMKKHLITYSYPSNFTFVAERPQGLDQAPLAKMDHLVCFLPGTIALATTGGLPLAQARKKPTWSQEQEDDMKLAAELMNTCWGMYLATKTGLAAEITHFHLHSPPLMYDTFKSKPQDRPHSPFNFDKITRGHDFAGRDDFWIKAGDVHNLQRPETVESLFYMWRITGDEKYRNWGWQMYQNFVKWTVVPDGTGFSSLNSVQADSPSLRDNMESFWLAETLKYFYLLFSPSEILPLTEVVFNTEAHVFPRFELGRLFTTGWTRKPRDKDGNLIAETKAEVETKTLIDKQEATTTTETIPLEATPPPDDFSAVEM